MSNSNGHKPGYKHTPMGWIPEDWEVIELGEVLTLKRGYDLTNLQRRPGKVPVITSGGMNGYHDTAMAKAPGIVTGRYGTVGEVFYCETDYWPHNTTLYVHEFKKAEPIFAYHLLRSINFRKYSDKSAVQGINRNHLHNEVVAIPLKSKEQRRIADILSTWDEAITQSRQLIAQLQQRNQGLMQHLLTGRKRLRGFNGEWKKVHIHEIAKEVVLKNKNGKDLTVLSCTKYDGLVPSLEYFGRRVFGSDTSTYKIVPQYHFAYATNHIEEGSIGYQSRIEEALISPMYTVFKTSGVVHDDYLFKLLKSHHYIHEYCKRMEGSIDRRGGLRWNEFSKITVCLPELEEQKSIASVLNKAADEVQLYEHKLAALQQQKKGLMQKLLTGKVRVKI